MQQWSPAISCLYHCELLGCEFVLQFVNLSYCFVTASLVAQMVKYLPAVQETGVRPLEEEMTTHSSILAWRIPQTEEPGGLQSTESHRGKHN